MRQAPVRVAADIDPITFAVMRNGVVAAARQVFTAFRRSGMHPLIYESHDFSVSLFDDRVNLVAEASLSGLLSGAVGESVESSVECVGRQTIEPGDLLLTNLPSFQGVHTPDMILTEPVFVQGELIGYIALRAHVGDVGGASFMPTTTNEVFQEGLLLPPLKLYAAGRCEDVVLDIMRANSRTPEVSVGNTLGGVGALRAGGSALSGLVDQYGVDVYRAAVDAILSHGELVARQAIAAIPDGVYTADGALDDNGVEFGVPVPIRLTLTIDGDHMTVDTTGSAPQQQAPVNCHFPLTQAAARMMLKAVATSGLSSNSGEHRALTVVAPEGSLFNPSATAASFWASRPAAHLMELLLPALAQALPEETPAGRGCDLGSAHALLHDDRSSRSVFSMYIGGSGHGATRGGDGPSAVYLQPGLRSVPLEVLETRDPAIRLRFELDRDSGGPGRWRGGLGMICEQEYLAHGLGFVAAFQTSGVSPIPGAAGGKPPRRLYGVIYYAGSDHEIRPPDCRASNLPIAPGDRFISWTAGGGGYGDPLERDPEAVAWDVKNDYVSREAALREYGAVVSEDGSLRAAATLAERNRLRAGARDNAEEGADAP
jgi:N-methylhydantoinase B